MSWIKRVALGIVAMASFLGGVWLSGWSTHAAAEKIRKDLEKSVMGQVLAVRRLDMEHLDRRFDVIEKLIKRDTK